MTDLLRYGEIEDVDLFCKKKTGYIALHGVHQVKASPLYTLD